MNLNKLEKYKVNGRGVYIFTFCSDQRWGGRCQIIMARDFAKARDLMFENFGPKWGFQYTEDEWRSLQERTGFHGEKPLKQIIIEQEDGYDFIEVDILG